MGAILFSQECWHERLYRPNMVITLLPFYDSLWAGVHLRQCGRRHMCFQSQQRARW